VGKFCPVIRKWTPSHAAEDVGGRLRRARKVAREKRGRDTAEEKVQATQGKGKRHAWRGGLQKGQSREKNHLKVRRSQNHRTGALP
jgi:hypothetical protein